MRHISTSAKNKDLESTKKNMFSADRSQLIPAEKVGPGWSWDANRQPLKMIVFEMSPSLHSTLKKPRYLVQRLFGWKSDGRQIKAEISWGKEIEIVVLWKSN